MYQEINPSILTQNAIESIWIYKGPKDKIKFNVLPDACVDLIIDLNQNRGFVSGLMTQHQEQSLGANAHIIGIRLKAEHAAFLTGLPLGETNNQKIDFSQLDPSWDSTWMQKLYDFDAMSDKVYYLEKYIFKKAESFKHNLDNRILTLTNNIRKSKGKMSIIELAKSNLISTRHLERKFKKEMGVTLKAFSNIIRFTHAKSQISKSPHTSLLEIAYNAGYYDHAHMNKEINRIAGKNPSAFR